jgi:hypothetical protein
MSKINGDVQQHLFRIPGDAAGIVKDSLKKSDFLNGYPVFPLPE